VLGLNVFEQGWDFMLKAATVEWQGSATVHDHLDIAVGIERWGTTSFDVGFTGTVEDRPVFTARVTYVGVRAGTQEKMPAPAHIRELLGGPPRS
jgi:acyl-CoA thioesterase FadM